MHASSVKSLPFIILAGLILSGTYALTQSIAKTGFGQIIESLDISEQQKLQLEFNIQSHLTNLVTISRNPNLTQQKRTDELKNVLKEIDLEFKQFLSPPQYGEYQALRDSLFLSSGEESSVFLLKKLKLSSRQKATVLPLLRQHLIQMSSIRNNPQLDPRLKKRSMHFRESNFNTILRKLISPEQYKEWIELSKQSHEARPSK